MDPYLLTLLKMLIGASIVLVFLLIFLLSLKVGEKLSDFLKKKEE